MIRGGGLGLPMHPKGPYTNYVDKILKIFDPPPPSVDKFAT